MTDTSELKPGEVHPMAASALGWLYANHTTPDLLAWMESFSSCAIEGNRLAEVCAETLDRLLKGEPVSDRYLLGLCWAMRTEDWIIMKKVKPKSKKRKK